MTVSLKEMLDEAFNNFNNNRFGNSGKLFRRISEEIINQTPIDAVYHFYLTLLSYDKMDDQKEYFNAILSFADLLLKHVVTRSSKLIESAANLDEKLDYLKIAIKSLTFLYYPEHLESVISAYLKVMDRKIENTDKYEYKLSHLYDSLSQAKKINREKADKISMRLISIYLEAAKHELTKVVHNPEEEVSQKDNQHAEEMAAVYYTNLISFIQQERLRIERDTFEKISHHLKQFPELVESKKINNVLQNPEEYIKEGSSNYIIVDGPNMLRNHHRNSDEKIPLSKISILRNQLEELNLNVIITLSAGTRHYIDDQDLLDQMFQDGFVKMSPAGSDDDDLTINLAMEYDGFILSNDQYKDYQGDNEVKEFIESNKFTATWDEHNGRYILDSKLRDMKPL